MVVHLAGTGESIPCHSSPKSDKREEGVNFFCFKVYIFRFLELAMAMPILPGRCDDKQM